MVEKSTTASPLSYAQAGVDIDAGNALVERIKPIAARTSRPEVCASIGGFAALFELPLERYQRPVLVSATDGVGTKLKLALAQNDYHGIGIDLVAMCANDLIVCGAEPLYFLDYFATGKLNVSIAEQVIDSIGRGCQACDIALIGGETAEMPGVYHNSDFDLAGFCVGVVEKNQIIDGNNVKAGDALIGIASSGAHANGYSLIRSIIEQHQVDLSMRLGDKTLGDSLLTPTKLYVRCLRELLKHIPIHAAAHITGGGLIENIPRVLPQYTQASIDVNAWQQPALFNWLKDYVANEEMVRTFNCGIGMVLCVAQNAATTCLNSLREQGEQAWYIGEIEASSHTDPQVVIRNL